MGDRWSRMPCARFRKNAVVPDFDRAYRQHRSAVASFLRRRCAGSLEVEDAVQETFLTAWRIWDRATGVDNLRNWLLGIARRVVGHMLRALKSRPQISDSATIPDTVQPATQEIRLYVNQLQAHFANLGPKQRASLEAAAIEDYGNAASLHLARQNLKKRFGVDAGQFSTVG